MPILYIEDGDLGAAEALESVTHDNVIKFNLSSLPGRIVPLHDITLAAHSNEDATRIGGKTPAELALDFSRFFQGRDKRELRDLYLISCEAGMCMGGKVPLAQQFAMEMQRQGFLNVAIHAVTNPTGRPIAGMRVEVVTKGGASGNTPGHVNAYLYENKHSERLDDDISRYSERLEFLRIKARDGRLTAAESTERTSIRELLRALQDACRSDTNYKRVDFFSAANYKEVMSRPYNTFDVSGPKARVSAAVASAIDYLQQIKKDIRTLFPEASAAQISKFVTYLDADIAKLQAAPHLNIDEIHEKLKGGRNTWQLRSSTYYTVIIQAMEAELRATESRRMAALSEPAVPVSTTPARVVGAAAVRVAPAPVRIDPAPLAHPPAEKNTGLEAKRKRVGLCDRLRGYKEMREKEWDFHFNFLNIISLLYFVMDVITGSDHFNSKCRESKVNAADKIIRSISSKGAEEVDPLTPSEENALQEGRLGEIVEEFGGLEEVKGMMTDSAEEPEEHVGLRHRR